MEKKKISVSGIAHFFVNRWSCESGYRQVLSIAVPLILSTSALSIQHFVDRMFLAWYSPEAIAAAMPASMLNFTLLSLFIGTASYASTFVAQYYGSGRYKRIGPVLSQGLYIAILGGMIHLMLIPLARPIFRFVGHEPLVQQYETIYFQVLCLGATPAIACSALSGFFSGRGKAWPVVWVSAIATAVNLIMNYVLIFGKWGLPELGIKGAAIGTVTSSCLSLAIYFALLSRPIYKQRYHTLRSWAFDKSLFSRLVHFGLPSGIQWLLDMIGFTIFILLVGRLGTMYLVATNIALNINGLAFMPMMGFGTAVSVLVGQHLGENRPHLAKRSVYSSFHLTFLYMAIVAIAYVFIPDIFIAPFAPRTNPASFVPIRKIAINLLRFVAVYSLSDTLNIVFTAAIKGAGDTRFVMIIFAIVASTVLVIPTYIALVVLHADIYTAWIIFTIYVTVMGFIFLFRFLGGKWKSMRVIEVKGLDQSTV